MNKKITELEGKNKELTSQLHLLQDKATEVESQLITQQEENAIEVHLVYRYEKMSSYSTGL